MKDNNDMNMLVTEAKKGNQAAYEALYQKTKQMVYFTCLGLLNSETDAADQMQETYAAAFQKLDMLEEPEKFPGWINRIAINKCKDFLIRQKRWHLLPDEKDIPEEVPETDEDFLPEDYLMKRDMREIVQKIMREELSDVQYRTVLLYYYDELSLTEIVEYMECSEGTVKSRLHKAKELIREGVLKYSKKHDDTLYCIAALPFLARLLQLEAEQLQAPALNPDFLQNTNGQNPANQQNPKQNLQQDVKQQLRKGKLKMDFKGLLSTAKGKILAASLALLVIIGGIAGVSAITDHDGQRNENQGNGNQEDYGQETETGGNDGEMETAEPEVEYLIGQISFTDAATEEDYLSGHIENIRFYGWDASDKRQYVVLDDKRNVYLCTEQSDVKDIYKEGSQMQWNIQILYENVKLDAIEGIWETYHYNLYTGERENGADGHEKCLVLYGNGYLYRDGEEYDLNAILPIDKIAQYWYGKDYLLIVDTSGNLHYWEGGRGLDVLNDIYPEYEPVGFLDYYEAPVCGEFQQGNCVDVAGSRVLLSDGKLMVASSPMNIEELELFDLDAYTYEQRIALDGVKGLYSGGSAILDTEGKIHVGLNYIPSTQERSEIIVNGDYEGEILNIYQQSPRGLLLQTTDGYYFNISCLDIEDDDAAETTPFIKLTVLESAPSPIREFVKSATADEILFNLENDEFLFLLEDGTVWGLINSKFISQ